MTNQINLIEGIVVGQFGDNIEMEIVDSDGIAVDVSTYTGTLTITLLSPDSLKKLTYANDSTANADFTTTGADGKVYFTPASDDIDRPGTWQGQVSLTSASAKAPTQKFNMIVEEEL